MWCINLLASGAKIQSLWVMILPSWCTEFKREEVQERCEHHFVQLVNHHCQNETQESEGSRYVILSSRLSVGDGGGVSCSKSVLDQNSRKSALLLIFHMRSSIVPVFSRIHAEQVSLGHKEWGRLEETLELCQPNTVFASGLSKGTLGSVTLWIHRGGPSIPMWGKGYVL